MARVKTKGLDEGYRISVKDKLGQVALRVKGKRPELVMQSLQMHDGTVYFGYIHSAPALRALARAILREVPARRKRGER